MTENTVITSNAFRWVWTFTDYVLYILSKMFFTPQRPASGIRVTMKGVAFALVALMTLIAALPCDGGDKKEGNIDKKQQKSKKDIQQIIFEEQKIEGKIRRPQLVLIKADQRPVFSPMVMQSFGKNDNIAEFVDQSAIENQPNQNAFQFGGTKVINFVP